MPSYGLAQHDCFVAPYEHSIGISWDVNCPGTPLASLHPRPQCTGYFKAEDNANIQVSQSIPEFIMKVWDGIQTSTSIHMKRTLAVIETKIAVLNHGYYELHREQEVRFDGLLVAFNKIHDDMETRIAQLRTARCELSKEQVTSQPQSIQYPPSTSRVVDEAGHDKRPTAIKRFEEVASCALPILESARRFSSTTNPQIRNLSRKIRMDINRRIGQISNSRSQVNIVVRELQNLLNSAWKSHGPDLLNYCILIISEKIIEQAETQVSLHSPSAFPIAQVVVDLCLLQKGLMPVLVYLIMERCPYAVPRYIAKREGQNDFDHQVEMGYLSFDGKLEGDQAYTERMAGILCLYGAIMQAKPLLGGESPYGIGNAWLWLASVLNIHPQPITPFLICSFLEVHFPSTSFTLQSAGYELNRIYPAYQKLVRFIKDSYLTMIPSGSVSAKTRLELYVDAYFERSPPQLKIPEGAILLR